MNSYIVNNSKINRTIIFYDSNNIKKIVNLKKKGVKLIRLKVEKDNYFDLKKIFKKVYELGIYTLLIECGKVLTYKMISNRLFNEFFLFRGSKILNQKDKVRVLDIKRNLSKKFKNKDIVSTYLEKDKLIHYY